MLAIASVFLAVGIVLGVKGLSNLALGSDSTWTRKFFLKNVGVVVAGVMSMVVAGVIIALATISSLRGTYGFDESALERSPFPISIVETAEAATPCTVMNSKWEPEPCVLDGSGNVLPAKDETDDRIGFADGLFFTVLLVAVGVMVMVFVNPVAWAALLVVFTWPIISTWIWILKSSESSPVPIHDVAEKEVLEVAPVWEWFGSAIGKGCKKIGGTVVKRVLVSNATAETFESVDASVAETGKLACLKDEKNATEDALDAVREIVFEKSPEEDASCRRISEEYARFEKAARNSDFENELGYALSNAVKEASDEIQSEFWHSNDALDYVAFMEPGFIDVRTGTRHADSDGTGKPVAVWKSEAKKILMDGESEFDGCVVVLSLKGEKPSEKSGNYSLLKIRSSNADATGKILEAVKYLADFAERQNSANRNAKEERESLGIGE